MLNIPARLKMGGEAFLAVSEVNSNLERSKQSIKLVEEGEFQSREHLQIVER